MSIVRVLLFGLMALLITQRAGARGEFPPPPPFTGGNQGAWLGSGPIFGFEPGGGSMGGWGGGWWQGGGWGGWGYGSGGNGGYPPGGHRGPGGGTPLDTGRGHVWEGDNWESCFRETLTGGYSGCSCQYNLYPSNPPAPGALLWGICRHDLEWVGRLGGCEREGMKCGFYYEP